MEVVLAQPRGFCAGVVRAIEIVEIALEIHGSPVYVYHEIVHNQHVVDDLASRGAIFVEDMNDIPKGEVVVFSAHGVSNKVVSQAKLAELEVIDATCPLVTKVHLQAQRWSKKGYDIVIVGHIGHEEVEGTMGSVDGPVFIVSDEAEVAALKLNNPEKVAYVTQTTLSLDDTRGVIEALKHRFPAIEGPGLDDICYATQNRQNAVRDLVKQVDLLLVVGAQNSSNSNRLRELGQQCGVESYLINNAGEIDISWLAGKQAVGLTAGASAPEVLVEEVIHFLKQHGVTVQTTMDGVQESTVFVLPKALLKYKKAQAATGH